MKQTILVVKGDTASRRMICAVLENAGYTVVALDDVDVAESRLERDAFDAIVVDFKVSDAEGLSFVKKLRQLDTCKTTPVVMLTNQVIRAENQEIGLSFWQLKPLNLDKLLEAINTAVRFSYVKKVSL